MTREEALEALIPYKGQKGRYKEVLGDQGVLMAHLAFDGSPSSAAEFFGYTHRSSMSTQFAKLGLGAHRRDPSNPRDGWRRFDNQRDLADVRAEYLRATGTVERALHVEWQIPPGTEYARLIALGDTHYGEASMDYRRWLDLRDWIADHPEVRWLHHGDVWDCALVNSPGRAMQRQVISFEDARDLALEDMQPIADQCIGIIAGNHDLRIARATQAVYCPARELARELGVPYLGEEAFVRYSLTDGERAQEYVGYHIHGTGGGDTWGGFCNRLERIARRNSADFLGHGHFHKLVSVPLTYRDVVDDGRIVSVEVPLIGTGSFLKLEGGGYAAGKGLAPPSLGAGTFHLYLDRHAVHART